MILVHPKGRPTSKVFTTNQDMVSAGKDMLDALPQQIVTCRHAPGPNELDAVVRRRNMVP
jgi:hypothetical protein